MNSFKTQRFLEADPPRFSRRDEAKVPYEESAVFVDGFLLYALQFASKKWREGMSKIDSQRSGTDNRTVMELNVTWLMSRPNLTLSLQISDRIDEQRISPRFCFTPGMRRGDNISRRLFNDAEALEL